MRQIFKMSVLGWVVCWMCSWDWDKGIISSMLHRENLSQAQYNLIQPNTITLTNTNGCCSHVTKYYYYYYYGVYLCVTVYVHVCQCAYLYMYMYTEIRREFQMLPSITLCLFILKQGLFLNLAITGFLPLTRLDATTIHRDYRNSLNAWFV